MIRKIENDDINRIMEIWLSENLNSHNFISPNYWKINYNFVKRKYLTKTKMFVYEKENKIVAYICIMYNNYIRALFVDKSYQKQGIGTELLSFAIKNCKNVSLAVYKENKKAIQFYIQHGFKIKVECEDKATGAIECLMFLTR
ncbi:MAG: GNAT family N-acetyltransferase [Clostridia bacterium]